MPPSVTRAQSAASVLTIALAALASAAGLLVPGLYRDPAVLLPQVYGQDLLTLTVAVPALAVTLWYTRRGSQRAYLVWLGVTAYVLYTYTTYSLMTAFNELYLAYTTLVFLSLYTLGTGLARLDAAGLANTLQDHSIRPYVVFEVALPLLVGFLWLSEIVPAMLAGTTPASASSAGLPVNVIHSIDLGIILPGFLLTAHWLRNRRPWGYAFTGVLLVKGATLGAAILAMAAWMTWEGQVVPLPQIVVFVVVTLTSVGLLVRFLAALGPSET